MDHKTLEVKATTTTDLGEFTALAAAYTLDRMGERIVPGAFKGTIEAHRARDKSIPLHWDHSAAAEDIIGTVDPADMRETEDGLEVKGQLDLEESSVAKDAWRLMKKNAVGLSFGYMVLEDRKGADGVRELTAVDLFEITITPAPANPDTRFMDLKNIAGIPFITTEENQRLADAGLVVDWDNYKQYNALKKLVENGKYVPKPENAPKWADPDAIQISPESIVEGDELKGAQEGDLQNIWITAYIKNLPDTAFLHERRFHYRDADGVVDVPHLKNALKRIPESDLPTTVKETLTQQGELILNDVKTVERSEEPEEAKLPPDPLETQYDDVLFDATTKGIDTSQPTQPVKEPEPEPTPEGPSLDELEAELKGIEMDILTRGEAIENG